MVKHGEKWRKYVKWMKWTVKVQFLCTVDVADESMLHLDALVLHTALLAIVDKGTAGCLTVDHAYTHHCLQDSWAHPLHMIRCILTRSSLHCSGDLLT